MRRFMAKTICTSKTSCVVLLAFLWVLPVSSNYKLDSYEFGGGGGVGESSNYGIQGVLGDSQGSASSSSYGINSGLTFEQNANVPTVTLSNNGNWYNKLLVIIGPEGNPSDATYAIAISDDNFVTTEYVQSDNTVGSSLGSEDYQTYAAWGGASGEYIIGLSSNTQYKVKVKALQGEYTESAYGPLASATTSNVSLTFDLDVGGSSDPGESSHPYVVSLGELTPGSITTATNRVWIDLSTNAEAGAYVYVYDQYGGLRSANHNYTISSVTNDLSGVSEGFGIQGETVGQTSGGPLAAVSPYDGSGNSVGIVSTTIRELFSTSGGPITAGRGSFLLKTKPGTTTPASGDYTDTLTFIASSTF
jgi:hypothetical protein